MLSSEDTAHVLDAVCRLDLCGGQSQWNAASGLASAKAKPALIAP